MTKLINGSTLTPVPALVGSQDTHVSELFLRNWFTGLLLQHSPWRVLSSPDAAVPLTHPHGHLTALWFSSHNHGCKLDGRSRERTITASEILTYPRIV